jgi:CheY-like chemotaxis protein
VVTDIMMPEMDGIALARELQRLDAALPIVGISGLHDHVRSDELLTVGVKRFLAKPFTASDLLTALQDSLA